MAACRDERTWAGGDRRDVWRVHQGDAVCVSGTVVRYSPALLAGLRGGALLITGGFTLTPFPGWYSFLGSEYFAGIPVPVIVFVAAFVAVHMLMNRTPVGRKRRGGR